MQRHIEREDAEEDEDDIEALEAEMAATAEIEAMIEAAGIDATLADTQAAPEQSEDATPTESADDNKEQE